MRIALVHDYLVQFGGAERTLLVLAELFPDAPIYTLLYDRGKMARWFGGKDVRTSFLDALPEVLTGHHRFLLPFFSLATRSLNISGYDVVISSSSSFAKGVRVESGAVHISYCYSPTRFLWDYQERYMHDNRFGFFVRKALVPLIAMLRAWDKHAARGVGAWIAPSHVIQERIKKYYGADSEVIYPPIDVPPPAPSHGKAYAKDYYLIVSRLSAYKKIDLVVAAFNKLQMPLVIVGDGPERERLERIAHSNIIFKGFVDDGELPGLYQHARAVIVAVEEDFGLTAAEAAYYGKPTLAYQSGGVAEWLEPGKTGEFFDEQSVESLAQGVYKIAAHEYDAAYLKKKAAQFSKKVFQDAVSGFVSRTLDARTK
jgi:glycosyltransferase involved in cell wall biosynthesis